MMKEEVLLSENMGDSPASSNLLKEISRNRSRSQEEPKELDDWGFSKKKLQCGNDLTMTKTLISQIQSSICLMKTDYPSEILDRLDLINDTIKDPVRKKEFDTLHSDLLWFFVKHQVEVTLSNDIKEQKQRDNEILLKISDNSQLLQKNEKLESKCKEFDANKLLIQALEEEMKIRSKKSENVTSLLKHELNVAESQNVILHEKLDVFRNTDSSESMLLEKHEELESQFKIFKVKEEKNIALSKKLVDRLNDAENRLFILKNNLKKLQIDNVALQNEVEKYRSDVFQSKIFKDYEKLILKSKEFESRDEEKTALGHKVMIRVQNVEKRISNVLDKLQTSEKDNKLLREQLEAIQSNPVHNSKSNHEERALLRSTTQKVLEQETIILELEKTNLLNKNEYKKTMKYFAGKSSEAMQVYNNID